VRRRPGVAVLLLALAAAGLVGTGAAAAAVPSSSLRLRLVHTVYGAISPKSVVISPTGLVFAQNMMYRHTMTVYDRRFRLVKTIPDAFRLGGHGVVRGAPVEAAFSPRGRFAYVSNYSMYGAGFGRPGDDVCSPASDYDTSYVYRVSVRTLRIDRAIRVGSVPKYVAVTPDNRFVLVSNWCSYDLSVISVRSAREVRRIRLGTYPRGIAVDPTGRAAYVAVMGTSDIARLDLRSFRVTWLHGIGSGPRHLVMGRFGRYLYATLNGEGRVAKIDLRTRRVVARVSTGSAPRSMTIAPDGRSLYVVNYDSGTVSKIRAADMRVVQTVRTNQHPIGIAYDGATNRLWVSCYTGSILIFKDTGGTNTGGTRFPP
jgi:YVTN family beta-propeller protein